MVNICVWNIGGLTDDKVNQKVIGPFLQEQDIIAISETWLRENNFEIVGYQGIHFIREDIHKNAKRGSGGISIFVKNRLSKAVSVVNQYKDIWCG